MTTTLIAKVVRTVRPTAALLVAMLSCALAGSSLAQSTANPGVLPPSSKPYGQHYGQWSAQHWEWLYSLPADHHPLFDTADCSAGQSGPVWFLGGTFTVIEQEPGVIVGNATRNCTVSNGKALFFPIIDAECATAEGNGTTDAELRACAEYFINHVNVNELLVEINGRRLQNLAAFRVQSPLFTWGPLPDNNVLQATGLDVPAGTMSPSVSDGYFVMLAPLSAGHHTLHFKGSIVFTQEQDGFDFVFALDITYNLIVAR